MEEERRLCYVGMTRARKRLYLSFAKRRMLFNQITHNPPSAFLKEIPERLITDEWAEATRGTFAPEPPKPALPLRRERTRNLSFGTPGMSATSRSALNIPGVQKGFVVPSLARQTEVNRSAVGAVFQPGDLIMHRKFGEGTVQAVTGTGADARIQIAFTAYGTKEFSLSIAPIVKID